MKARLAATAWVMTPSDGGDAKSRRLPRLDRMALEVARQALAGVEVTPSLGLIFGTGYGGLTATAEFLEGMGARGYPFGSPTAFHQSVHHSAAGQLSIALDIRGPSLTVSARELSGETALRAGLDLLETGRVEQVLVVAADERVPVLDAGYRAFGVLDRFAVSEGAAAVLLDSIESIDSVRVERCQVTAHPCELLRFPTEHQLRPLLGATLGAATGPVLSAAWLAAPMAEIREAEQRLVESLSPATRLSLEGERFGFHGSAGLMRLAAAARALALRPRGERVLVHGMALGGGQAVTVLERA